MWISFINWCWWRFFYLLICIIFCSFLKIIILLNLICLSFFLFFYVNLLNLIIHMILSSNIMMCGCCDNIFSYDLIFSWVVVASSGHSIVLIILMWKIFYFIIIIDEFLIFWGTFCWFYNCRWSWFLLLCLLANVLRLILE